MLDFAISIVCKFDIMRVIIVSMWFILTVTF